MSQLKIYRASAGSGKTFTLTGEYLNLVFQNPLNYREILAVTFTNKATDEMKSRILKEIYSLSKGEKSAYAETLCSENNISEEELQKKASYLLSRLLHDYSRFSVTTIDSFFQKIVRSFTREIGLQMGYNIELDTAKVLDEVADLLLNNVENEKKLRKWLIDFAETKMRNGKSWNFKYDILDFGNEIFKEDFQNFSQILMRKLADKNFLELYKNKLNKLKEDIENHFALIGDRARIIMANYNLQPNDFTRKASGVGAYLSRLGVGGKLAPNSYVRAAADSFENWTPKTASSELKVRVNAAIAEGLGNVAVDAVQFYDENELLYFSVEQTISYIYTLGILTDLSAKIQQYCEEQNIFLLSSATKLLRVIIAENDSPFLYEKIGNYYKYFMIDEFQDTSSMQWDNFRPLVNNALAEGYPSLVVGDVKQSIYRWRNGDWKLLAEQLEKDFKQFEVKALHLDKNWRSSENVINFNNAVFALGANILQEYYNEDIPDGLKDELKEQQQKIADAYADVYQHLGNNTKENRGCVKLQFFKDEKENPWKEKVALELPNVIAGLQQKGYNPDDIAILVRNGKEGAEIADILMNYKKNEDALPDVVYDVISSDALYLKNSRTVQFIIHLMYYLLHPEEALNIGFLRQEYLLYYQNREEINDELFFVEKPLEDLFPDDFMSNVHTLKRETLFDLTEKLIDIFKLNNNSDEYAYLEAFQDLVLTFTKTETADLNTFLEYWNERKDKEVISIAEEQDAMRILTIHKSKGLEFKVVILPYIDWDLDDTKHRKVLWCQPDVMGFNALDILPVKYGSKLKNTIYYGDYYQERLQTYIDNLNLLYVAQTRAENVFVGFAPDKHADKLSSVADLLKFTIKNSHHYSSHFNGNTIINLSENWDDANACFELGELTAVATPEKEEIKYQELGYVVNMLDDRLKLRSRANEYFDFSESTSVDDFSPVSRGNLLHQLFQLINYADDLEKAIGQLQFEGKLDENQAKEFYRIAYKILHGNETADWFSKSWKVINERDIFCGKDIYRPDRVIYNAGKAIVIDYKFGIKKEKKYEKQVKKYVELVKQLGFSDVKGYVLYGNLGEVVSV